MNTVKFLLEPALKIIKYKVVLMEKLEISFRFELIKINDGY